MTEIEETINESLENANESKLNSKIAIFVAITATFMAIFNIKSGNIAQNMSKAQSKAVNNWAYFQSKSTKQNITENSIDILKSQVNITPSPIEKKALLIKIAKLEDKVERYENEKNEIKTSAEAEENAYEKMNVFDDQFDMTEAILSISVALFGLSALTQKKQLFYFALILSLSGIILGLSAFLNISYRFDFISNILG